MYELHLAYFGEVEGDGYELIDTTKLLEGSKEEMLVALDKYEQEQPLEIFLVKKPEASICELTGAYSDWL